MPPNEFFIFCKINGGAVVKQMREEEVHEFPDLMQAIVSVQRLKAKGSTLTVMDPEGKTVLVHQF